MKNIISKILVAIVLLTGITSCEIDPIFDPNGPTVESYTSDATPADLQLLVSGLESIIRNDMEFYYNTVCIVGREYYDLNNTDPRYTGELLGAEGAVLDNNGFLTTRSFSARHRSIRNGHILIEASTNSSSISVAERNGYIGFAETIQAYEMLLELTRQYENGIRLDTRDPDNMGPYSDGYQAGLTGVMNLLNSAKNHLDDAGSSFNFILSYGFAGYDDPAGFALVNRALAARVALYQNDMSAALTALDNSFLNLSGDLYDGVYYVFGSSGNDIRNPLFFIPGPEVDKYTIHPSWLTDAEPGDNRVTSKTEAYGVDVTADGLTGNTQIALYSSDTDPVPMIRNEELILIYAEANAASNSTQAIAAIDAVRTAAGLAGYSGDPDEASLIDEILNQRRYSLVGEGHRWIDMRRMDRLDEIPTDRPGDVVHLQFPRPAQEPQP